MTGLERIGYRAPICVAVTAMISAAGRGANAFMCVFKAPAFFTIHDGGLVPRRGTVGRSSLEAGPRTKPRGAQSCTFTNTRGVSS
jgi:hypothetical protein